ncbi:MAG: LysR substrate-binding domain-containing protein [Gammaproteobacteria bacterium]
MPVSLRGLRAFCAAAHHESFRIAGEDLFITPSAVSHQIKNLEDVLGDQLFERNGRDLKLSSLGVSLYEEVGPLINQLEDIVGRYMDQKPRASIRISVQPFFASECLIPRLNEFTEANPEIDIKIGTSDETADRHPPDADMSIRLFRTPPPEMQSDLLFPLRLAPAGSPDFKRRLKVKDGKILSDFPIIVHETYPNAWKQWAETSGLSLPKSPKVTRLDSMIAVVRAAQRGSGAALVPVPISDLWFKEGSIVRLFDQDVVASVSYYLVCAPELTRDERLATFREWILRTFAVHT